MSKFGCIVFSCFVCFNLHANILTPPPETNAKSNAVQDSKQESLEFSKRHRFVSYQSNYLFAHSQNARTQASQRINQSIELNLFDDTSVKATALRTFSRADGKTVWIGRVSNDPNSSVNLIADSDQLTANIRTKGQLFQIRTLSNGNLLVTEFNPPAKLTTDIISPPASKPISQAKQASLSKVSDPLNEELPVFSSVTTGFTDSADVSVLVYYTHQALESVPDLLNAIDLDFIDTNQAFANSGINASVSIAAKIAVDESPIFGGLAFEELAGKKGPFTNIDQVRDKYQADLVHFYSQRLKDACGLAYYAAFPDGYANREWGFGATAAYCTGNLTTAHELGHNFGAAHDRYVEEGGDEDSNYGYVDIDNLFQTIMAYTDQCDDAGLRCTEITHFSNPDKNYNELPTGVAAPVLSATNNAAQINFSALTLANFYGVATPHITSITQGESATGISIEWSNIDNATSYRVNRRQATIDSSLGALCSYPVYGDEFEVVTNHYIDTSAESDVTYCYSVVALNDQLLGESYSPESFVRTGYSTNNPDLTLPFIENITLDSDIQNLQSTITLPDTLNYQLAVVETSLDAPPIVSLTKLAPNEYQLELDGITLANQTVTIGLIATHQSTGISVAQLFNAFSNRIENQRPNITVNTRLELDQQSTATFAFNLTDDQAVAKDGIYAYSQDESVISRVWVTEPNKGEYLLNVVHEGLKTGEASVVIGYSDGEYVTEVMTNLIVNRTIFNPTQTQDVTWFIKPDDVITRLLPFYDVDEGENLTVTILDTPLQGQLNFVLYDKVTYTANSDFASDSFSFIVTGEDGIPTNEIRVNLELAQPSRLPAKQKIQLSGENAAFLSHEGHLYAWGRNDSGETGTQDPAGNIFLPTKIAQEGWSDIALRHSEAFAIKQDGTLWHVGYDFFTQQTDRVYTQVGADSDWQSVIGVDSNALVLLTKTDGSIWARGFNTENNLTNRAELSDEISEITQILPLYGVTDIQYTGETGFALTQDNKLYSWGSYRLSDLGRSENLGYLAEMGNITGKVTDLTSVSFRSAYLADGYLYAWGGKRSDIFFGVADELALPTQISPDIWKSIALGSSHLSAIKDDGTLWTAGGRFDLQGVPFENAELARANDASSEVNVVGTQSNWLKTWAGRNETFAMDDTGQIWVSGGESNEAIVSLNGLGESRRIVNQLTLIETIPNTITGTEDSDNDGLRDFEDNDDDNDSVLDQYDVFRTDPSESLDTDSDGIGNNADNDDDGDDIEDSQDAFPLDATESIDTDADGIGNNADSDDDNDGVTDSNDAFPLDASRSTNPTPPTTPNENSTGGGGGSLGYWLLLSMLLRLGTCSRKQQ